MSALKDLAATVYKDLGFSEEGLAELARRIAGNPEWVADAVKTAAYDLLTAAQRTFRRHVASAHYDAPILVLKDQGTPSLDTARVFSRKTQERVEQSAAGKFLLWPMMDGTPLGDADREHLLSDARRYLGNTKGNLREALFLLSLAERVGKKRVRQVFNDKTLGDAMRKASEDAKATISSLVVPLEAEAGD
jgi:hypothetical protein